MSQYLSEITHWVKGIDPIADAFAGTVNSDVVNMKGYNKCTFILFKGVGTTGTSTLTVEACDDVTPTTTSAVVFKYRAITTGDTHGALTAAAVAGFLTTAGSSQIYLIEVDSEELANDGNGYGYVRLVCVESVNSPVVGCIAIGLSEPRYPQAITDSAIT